MGSFQKLLPAQCFEDFIIRRYIENNYVNYIDKRIQGVAYEATKDKTLNAV